MKNRYGRNRQPIERKWPVDCLQRNLRYPTGGLGWRVEDVVERAPQVLRGALVRIRRDGSALDHVEAAHLVEPHHMIGVTVGEEDRIEPGQAMRQGLLPEVRGR